MSLVGRFLEVGAVVAQPELQVLTKGAVAEAFTEPPPFLTGEEDAQHVPDQLLSESQRLGRSRKCLKRAVGLVIGHHDPSHEPPAIRSRRRFDRDVQSRFRYESLLEASSRGRSRPL